jgi:hypothetical protein
MFLQTIKLIVMCRLGQNLIFIKFQDFLLSKLFWDKIFLKANGCMRQIFEQKTALVGLLLGGCKSNRHSEK